MYKWRISNWIICILGIHLRLAKEYADCDGFRDINFYVLNIDISNHGSDYWTCDPSVEQPMSSYFPPLLSKDFTFLHFTNTLHAFSHIVSLPVLHCPGVNNFGLQTRGNVKVLMSNGNLMTETTYYAHHQVVSNDSTVTKLDETLIQLLPKILLKVICDDGSFNLGVYSLKDDPRTK